MTDIAAYSIIALIVAGLLYCYFGVKRKVRISSPAQLHEEMGRFRDTMSIGAVARVTGDYRGCHALITKYGPLPCHYTADIMCTHYIRDNFNMALMACEESGIAHNIKDYGDAFVEKALSIRSERFADIEKVVEAYFGEFDESDKVKVKMRGVVDRSGR